MSVQSRDASEPAHSLELEVEAKAEAAKRAIREYKEAILNEPISGAARRLDRQREVEDAVCQYIQLLRKLDELLALRSAGSAR